MRYTFLISLLLFSSSILQAANITGTVKDNKGNYVPGVSIIYQGTQTGTISDSEGFYSLPLLIGQHFLVFTSIGYRDTVLEIVGNSKALKKNIMLEEDVFSLEEVSIIVKSKIQEKREQPNSISILDMNKLEGRSLSFADVLNQASGVKVLQKGGLGSSSRTFIQGLDGKGVSIFVNGMPMGSSEEFQANSIPTDMINNIEIYKGVVPANLGGDGLSGAINIITKDFSQSHLEASYEIASLNTHRANVIGKKYFNKSGIILDVNASYDYSDNDYEFNSPYVSSPEIIRCDHNTFHNYSANVGLSFTKQWFDVMSLSFGYSNQYKETQGGMMIIQSKIEHTHVKDRNFTSTQNFTKSLLNGKLKFDLSSMIDYSVENLVDTSSIRYNWNGTTEKRTIPGEWGSFPNNSDDKYWTMRDLLNFKYYITDDHSINWNTTFKYNKKDPSDPLNDEYSVYSATGYASKLQALVSGLTYGLNLFNGNLKNELSGKFFYHYSEVMPTNEGVITNILTTAENKSSSYGWSEAIALNLSKNFTIKASVSQAVRIPVSYEIFGDGVMITPSPSINPEKSFNMNAGLNWLIKGERDYPNFRVEINSFYMNVEDMIRLFSTESMKMAYINLDKARITGIEGDINSELTSWISTKLNFSYQDSRDNNKIAVGGGTNWHYDYRIPNMPYCFGNAGIDLHKENLFCRNSISSLSLDADYTHEFAYTWAANDNSTLIIPEKWNFNIGIRQSFDKHYHVSFEVHNLINKEQWSEFRYPLPGRTLHLKFRYTLH